jgi:hypothetical protein
MIFFTLLLLISPLVASAQSRITFPEPGESDATKAPEEPETPAVDPPTGFGSVELGLEIEEVKRRLEADSNFLFRGDPDVSMLASPNESLIETKGSTYIARGYFQFHERKLYTIILELDRSRIDHYAMYTTFVERYGEPDSLDPTESVWEFDGIRLSLERPLRVKYIDTAVFDRIIEEQNRLESLQILSRDRFLDQF